MELLDIIALVGNPEELIKKIQATKDASKSTDKIALYKRQWDPASHDIMDTSLRADKTIEVDGGAALIKVARIAVPYQKKITNFHAAILCGNPIQLQATTITEQEKQFLAVLKRAWKDNKLDYRSKTLAKLMMSETEVAEIWSFEQIEPGYWKNTAFDVPAVKLRLRMKIVANKYGDTLYPVFNNTGDMVAFGRAYTVTLGTDKKEEHFDLYTEKTIYTMVKLATGWTATPAANEIGKIPVIYYSQDAPEWTDVQTSIDRIEKSYSNHSDTNDYHGDPTTLVFGDIKGFAKKGESGKVLQLENNADVKLLTWDQAPESVKMEQQNLNKVIFDMTDTPDITKDSENLSGVQSGVALKMRFLPAHMKAADKEETFGESIQRRINFMKKALVNINIKFADQETLLVEPKFEFYMPKNDQELIEMLNTATAAKPTMSQATATKLNPFVTDAEAELKLIKEDGADAVINEGL